jgi:hypothetical protein
VELIAGAGHVEPRDLRTVAGRCGVDIQDGHGVVAAWIGIQQRDVGQRLDGRLHGHRWRRIEGLVGKQFRHCQPLFDAVVASDREGRIRAPGASFENAGVFLKLS